MRVLVDVYKRQAQRGFAAQPFVVPAAGDLQQSAYKFHRGPRAGRTDVPVLVLYGLESMPTDFFRMSMTCLLYTSQDLREICQKASHY